MLGSPPDDLVAPRGLLGRPQEPKQSECQCGSGVQASRDGPAQHTVRLGSAEIEFSVGERTSSETHVSTREREAIARVTLDRAVPFEEWLERWVEPLVRLATFATRQPVVASSISALLKIDAGDASEFSTGEPERRQVQIVQPQRRLRRRSRLRWERMLVSYAALGQEFDSFIARWWEIHGRLAGAGDFLFGALRDPMSLEPQLVTLASVIEGYHRAFDDGLAVCDDDHEAITRRMLETVEDAERRELYSRRLRYANELTQHDRLIAVVRRAGEVIEPLKNKAGRLAQVVLATRNYFVHLEKKDPRVLEGARLYEANQLLILAVQCNLLLELGVTPQRAVAGIEHAYMGEPFWRDLRKRGYAWPKLPSLEARQRDVADV